MARMNEENAVADAVYCPHCGRIAFRSGHSAVYAATQNGGEIALQTGKAFYRCACGGESETEISCRTGRLYLREP